MTNTEKQIKALTTLLTRVNPTERAPIAKQIEKLQASADRDAQIERDMVELKRMLG